jgi:hypothetical protein
MLRVDVAGLFARDDGPNACQMACEMQPYFFIGKPEVTLSVGQPMLARADDTEIYLQDVETIKVD